MSGNLVSRCGGAGVLGAFVVLCIGCSDDAVAPFTPAAARTGSVRVTTPTTGQGLDPDGYRLFVDGVEGPTVAVNGSATLPAEVGQHELELTGVAGNCTVQGDNPRTVTVRDGSELRTAFRVMCEAIRQITVVSGDAQEGEVGHLLELPLVVRVTDDEGHAVEGVPVRWDAGPLGALDGRFDDGGEPVSAEVTRTDADGLVEASLMPLAFTEIGVSACVAGSCAHFAADATDVGAALVLVSGSRQVVEAGRVGEPLTVRVTDGEGNGVPHVAVDWKVWLGDGALLGRFDDDGRPITFDRTRTDADGLATMSLMPTWFGPVLVDASVFAGGVQESPATFMADATDRGAGLAMVSGDGQEGKVGGALGEPFVVRVRDGRGGSVANVRVDWSFDGESDTLAGSSYSDANGLASLSFSPSLLGTVRVIALMPGHPDRVPFATDVRGVVIRYQPGVAGWPNYFESAFGGWSCGWTSCWVYVPVGTEVEWVSHITVAHIVSTAAPTGGASFDSGLLSEGGRFLFVPALAGTWEYVDRLTGAKGELIVY